jgi:hypothetical protein
LARQDSYDESDITGHPVHPECPGQTTGIRIAVIGQKGPLFVFEDEKDNRYIL